MMNKIKTRDMVITALLTALTILIPIIFSPIRFPFGRSFSMTFSVHAPIFIAMFISPVSAGMVAIGSAIGFFFSAPLVIFMRAATHIIFAATGAYMILKMNIGVVIKLILVWLVTMLLHAGFEAAIVMAHWHWLGEPSELVYLEGYTVGIGTLIHHTIDYAIMLVILAILSKAKLIDWRFKKEPL
jgi:niacin transporter